MGGFWHPWCWGQCEAPVHNVALEELWADVGSPERVSQALEDAADSQSSVGEAYRVADGLPRVKWEHDAREAHQCQPLEWMEEAVALCLCWDELPVDGWFLLRPGTCAGRCRRP